MAERRARQLTFRGMKRRLERDERKDLQKTMGRWYYVSVDAVDSIDRTDGSAAFNLPRPDVSDKVTIYGMDCLLSIRLTSIGNGLLGGALVVCHVRKGQGLADFLAPTQALPVAAGGDNLARFRSFVPFQLAFASGTNGGDNYFNQAVIPYRFFRGHRVILLPGENLAFAFAFPAQATGTVSVNVRMIGRYRYLQEPS